MRRIVCALALLFAAPVWAQESETPPEPIAQAQHIIAAASAEDLFEALPSDHQVVMRHTRSRLTCRFDASWRNRIVIFAEAARGEDIACDSSNGSRTITLYATRYSFATNLRDQFSGAVDAIRRRFPDARDYAPGSAQASPGLPQTRSAAFIVSRPNDQAQMYTQVNVAMASGWVYVMRYTALAADAAAQQNAEAAAHRAWTSVLSEIAGDRP
jgi:hypothetical protein